MKRTLKWVLVWLFVFSSMASAGPLERFYKAQDQDRLIDLDESDVAVIELESNPSTGFCWNNQDEDSGHVRIIKREFVPDNPGMPGTSGVEKIYVVANSKGQSAMRFDYKRPFGKKITARSHRFRFNAKRKFLKNLLTQYKTSTTVQATAPEVEATSGSLSATLTAAPSSYNWCDENGGCPTVKNQGQCGSCWAFATLGPLEAQIKAAHGVEVDLSEQYLMSCNDEGYGCNGGWWGFEYLVDTKVWGEDEAGAVLESIMPYKDRDTDCNPPHAKAYKGSFYGYVRSTDVADLKQAMLDYGPLTVNVCVDFRFNYYTSGVFTGSRTCWIPNHGVVLVGWDDSTSSWIMRNSWGPDWGENGYMRIQYGANGIGGDAGYIVYDGGNAGGNTGGDDDDDNTCQQWTSTNDQHVNSGRAYTRQSFVGCDFVTNYYAVGTDESLGSSGYATTTLHTEDGGASYSTGTCP